MPFTLDEQIKEVRRELAMRKNAYPRWVSKGTMKQPEADRHMALMQAVHDTLVQQQSRATAMQVAFEDVLGTVKEPPHAI